MNDRFRFRAWDKSFSRMIYNIFFFWKENKITVYELEEDGSKYYLPNSHIVLEQCTDLKDKNGKLIYEGDIVKVTGDCMTIPSYLQGKLAKVIWEINCFSFYFPHEKESYFCECWEYEVIGNIHDNADLLEAQNG